MDGGLSSSLDVRGISKSLGGRKVLDDVSFSVPAGTLACLLGPNGSGKTTLLKILSTLVVPDSGSASIAGASLSDGGSVRARLGLDGGDERSFYGRLSTRENLLFFASLYGLSGKALSTKLEALSHSLGMDEFLGRPYQELSTGMKARVLLARALLHDPPVLLLDEPTRGLDPLAADRLVSDVLVPLARTGKAILMATHRLDEVERAGDQIIVLSKGRVAFVETRAGFKQKLDQGHLLDLLRSLEPAAS